jgi:hypothetical protein
MAEGCSMSGDLPRPGFRKQIMDVIHTTKQKKPKKKKPQKKGKKKRKK